jgi:hypothetical protein
MLIWAIPFFENATRLRWLRASGDPTFYATFSARPRPPTAASSAHIAFSDVVYATFANSALAFYSVTRDEFAIATKSN